MESTDHFLFQKNKHKDKLDKLQTVFVQLKVEQEGKTCNGGSLVDKWASFNRVNLIIIFVIRKSETTLKIDVK